MVPSSAPKDIDECQAILKARGWRAFGERYSSDEEPFGMFTLELSEGERFLTANATTSLGLWRKAVELTA